MKKFIKHRDPLTLSVVWICSKEIGEICETAGIQLHIVPYISGACPECGYQEKMNRVCARFTRKLIVPLLAKPYFVKNIFRNKDF